MKNRMIGMLLILFLCLGMLCACTQGQMDKRESDYESRTEEEQSRETEKSTEEQQSNEFEDNTEKKDPGGQVSGETIALVFRDYDDFIRFGKTGELDEKKFPTADILIEHYKLKDGAFVDVRAFLGIDPQDKGYTESVDVKGRNIYVYYLHDTKESKRACAITVEYDPKSAGFTNPTAKALETISEMDGQSGLFRYDVADLVIGFGKNDAAGYRSVSFYQSGYRISIVFDKTLTQAQIEEKFGKNLSAMLFGEKQKIEQIFVTNFEKATAK